MSPSAASISSLLLIVFSDLLQYSQDNLANGDQCGGIERQSTSSRPTVHLAAGDCLKKKKPPPALACRCPVLVYRLARLSLGIRGVRAPERCHSSGNR